MTIMTAADRCDRCGARATLRIGMTAGELFFCDHHAREYGFLDSLPRTIAATSGPAGE